MDMSQLCAIADRRAVQLHDGIFLHRQNLVKNYLLSLKSDCLLQAFYFEANIAPWSISGAIGAPDPNALHWGWESPQCQLRGHFLGHWLSGAAQCYALTGDLQIKAKADAIIAELSRCQEANGGQWLGPTPEKYLHGIARGKHAWAPQYVHHKTLMGLYDMFAFAGNQQALELADRFADWFHAWTKPFTREQMDNILDFETGGMLEAFANLYGVKKSQKYLDLIERYTRNRLFQPLLDGIDVLTNMHANTTIPEAHGAARCYEVTGEKRWRDIVEAYWRCAVTTRGYYATGGQTSGEMWNPPGHLAARRGEKDQEHCTVYNMIRLAEYLYRWTGKAEYLDYIERNLYNGILAQQNPHTGMVAYYLPMHAGGKKNWGHPTHNFWCCHGSLVQVHPMLPSLIYYRAADALTVAQYIPSKLTAEVAGIRVSVEQTIDTQAGNTQSLVPAVAAFNRPVGRPNALTIRLTVTADQPSAFTLRLRVPEWSGGKVAMKVNDQALSAAPADGYLQIARTWQKETVSVEFARTLRAEALPDEPNTVAFLDGPVVLAAPIDREMQFIADLKHPETILVPDNERAWGSWLQGWRTTGQPQNVRLKPLYDVVDEPFTIYFPIAQRP